MLPLLTLGTSSRFRRLAFDEPHPPILRLKFSTAPAGGRGDSAKLSGVRALASSPTSEEAELGMAALSEKYREAGDLYVPAEPAE